MNVDLRLVSEGVYATSRAGMMVEVADVIVFDMDGVLVNVHESYPVVIQKTVDAFLAEAGFSGTTTAVTVVETTYFKAAGGFNSDWALAQGVALIYLVKADLAGSKNIDGLRNLAPDLATVARAAGQYGGGLIGLKAALLHMIEAEQFERVAREWDCERLTRLAKEFYAGDAALKVFGIPNDTVKGDGLMLRETPLVDPQMLAEAPFRFGIYTGRNQGEVMSGIQMAGLHGVFEEDAIITETTGYRKPNPDGLFAIERAVKPKLMIYAGDNLDDWQTAQRYEAERALDAPPCLFCGVLGGSPGPLSYSLFQERGVDLMVSHVRGLLTWVTDRKRRLAGPT